MKKPCYSRIKFECYNLIGVELNVKVDVDDLKPEEQNRYDWYVGNRVCQMPRGSAA